MPATPHRTDAMAPPAVAWPILGMLAAAKLALHVATNGRYGFHRDELYYLTGGRELALGYVDHPPLVPWLAHLSETLFGLSVRGLRFWPALAGAALVVLAGVLAARLGGGRFAQAAAAAATLLCPFYLGANTLFQTVTFDQLWWMLALLALVELLRSGDRRWWLGFGLVAGLGVLTKYTFVALGLGVALAVVTTPLRRDLRGAWIWSGLGVCAVLALPNLLWQLRNGWPTLEFIANNSAREATAPAEFLLLQALFPGPLALPLVLGGWIWLWRGDGGRWRAVGIAAAGVFALFLALRSKPYYPGPLYAPLLAAGAVAWGRWLPRGARIRRTLLVALPVVHLVLLPYLVPIWSVETFASNQDRYPTEDFAEMFGWPELAAQVAGFWQALEPDEQERAAIVTGNYGQAAAIDLFGPAHGLPRAYSGHNSYWLWRRPPDFDLLLTVGYGPVTLGRLCATVEDLGEIATPHGVRNEEHGAPVKLCREMAGPPEAVWREHRHYE